MSGSYDPSRPPIEPIGAEVYVSTSPEERLWGMLAHLFGALGYFGGVGQFVGPLVVYLMYKDKSRFVAFHALQTLYFHLGLLVLLILGGFISVFTCGLFLLIISPIVAIIPCGALILIYSIVGAVQAHDGRLFQYWLVGRWARDQVRI